MSCFFWTKKGIFLPGKSWVSRCFKHRRSTMKEPGAPANQSRSSAVWSLKAWHPEAAKLGQATGCSSNFWDIPCTQMGGYTDVYRYIWYKYNIYIIYICTYLRGTKKICTCAIRLHPSSWFAPFGSLIQNWPRSKAIRTSHILGLGPLRASTFVSW